MVRLILHKWIFKNYLVNKMCWCQKHLACVQKRIPEDEEQFKSDTISSLGLTPKEKILFCLLVNITRKQPSKGKVDLHKDSIRKMT